MDIQKILFLFSLQSPDSRETTFVLLLLMLLTEVGIRIRIGFAVRILRSLPGPLHFFHLKPLTHKYLP